MRYHADHHGGTDGIQLSHSCCVCSVWMLKVATHGGNLVPSIVSELCRGGKIELLAQWILKVITCGGNLVEAITGIGLCCGGRWYVVVISVLYLKLSEVELVHAIPSANFGQNLLVVVVTQSSAELLVCHVCSAIPLSPQTSHLAGSFDDELSVCPLPRNERRVSWRRQNVENELEKLRCFCQFRKYNCKDCKNMVINGMNR